MLALLPYVMQMTMYICVHTVLTKSIRLHFFLV